MNFIDEHRVRFGVEPICRVLTEHGVKIAPSTYYAFKTRAISQRTVRDQELREHIERVFWDRTKGRGISGARKVWRLLKRDGVVTARCTVERLMRAQGLRGVRRGKQFVTTRPDPAANRAPDHVKRNFRAECPNELWVGSTCTTVRTHPTSNRSWENPPSTKPGAIQRAFPPPGGNWTTPSRPTVRSSAQPTPRARPHGFSSTTRRCHGSPGRRTGRWRPPASH